jgi:hypothetical protein
LGQRVGGALEDERPSWLEAALVGLTSGDWPEEWKVYRRVAETIRALAEMGRVIIVGRGGLFITRDMPGGIHLRLVAPLEHRVATTVTATGASKECAASIVREKDRNRQSFYRRHWPNHPLTAEQLIPRFARAASWS